MTDESVERIKKHARALMREIESPEDVREINQILAELEAYPEYVLRLEVVP